MSRQEYQTAMLGGDLTTTMQEREFKASSSGASNNYEYEQGCKASVFDDNKPYRTTMHKGIDFFFRN
jgi:hypothetical protein